MFQSALPTVIGISALVLVIVLSALVVVGRYRIAGPDQAIIITGAKGKALKDLETGQVTRDLSGQKVVLGAGVFVLPFVHQAYVLDLSARSISLSVRGAISAQGVTLNLDGVAIVKVGGTEDSIRAAAQRFLGQQAKIDSFTQDQLEGALRAIVGGLSVEQIIRDRAAFAAKVAEECEASLTGQGLVLDTFQIKDISDDGTYLRDLGRAEQARVTQVAQVAEAEARQQSEQARLQAERAIALAERDVSLQKAAIQQETDAAKARADAAGPLAEAAQQQAILAEQEKVAMAQAALTDRELDTKVRKPADAARYEVEQRAAAQRTASIAAAEANKASTIAASEAQKIATVAAAEAAASQVTLSGEAELAKRRALAEATRVEGTANADATLAIGTAEAQAMTAKASAYSQYSQAAVLEMLIGVLPQIAHEISAPMQGIDQLTVISTDGAGALPKQVAENWVQTLQMLKSATGVDLEQALTGLVGGLGSGKRASASGTSAT